MIKRVLAGTFGAVIFGVLAPLLYALLVRMPDSFSTVLWLAGSGMAIGAVLGALFPRIFGFVFEVFLDV